MSAGLAQTAGAVTLGAIDPVSLVPLFVVVQLAHIVVCWFAADALRGIPARYRFQPPEKAWLLLIPGFRLYWNFRVFPGIAESFQFFFYSHGVGEVEDCGERLGRAYCWLALCSLIPCLGVLLLVASAVVVVLFFVEADRLKKRAALLEGA